MEAEYATRKRQLLEECQVAPEIFDQVMARLETFMVPFVSTFRRQEPSEHAHTYVRGLLSEVARKNVDWTRHYMAMCRPSMPLLLRGRRQTPQVAGAYPAPRPCVGAPRCNGVPSLAKVVARGSP
jgi:hypothetical protein